MITILNLKHLGVSLGIFLQPFIALLLFIFVKICSNYCLDSDNYFADP